MNNPDLHHFWQQTLADWTASGLSGAAFCREHALSYCRFIYWRQKLNDRREPNDSAQAGPGFARVAPVADDDTPDGLTVSLPGGVSITGLHAGNIELLGAVLRQL